MAKSIRAKQGYDIVFCGPGDLREAVGGAYAVIDENVMRLHGSFGSDQDRTYILQAYEKNKTFGTAEAVFTHMLNAGADKHTAIAAIGGGITIDTAGFVAACYMRGVPLIIVPTTLLACADAGIGGKNGVNVGNAKNAAGTFYLPKSVYICTELLNTLSDAAYIEGMGELLKYALLDSRIFRLYSESYSSVLSRRQGALDEILPLCIMYKDNIAARDPFDTMGIRAALNLGHTVAHAIESASDYSYAHGNAVAAGLGVELELSKILNIADAGFYETAKRLITEHAANIPKDYPDIEVISERMRTDKKNSGGKTGFVLLKDFNKLEKVLLGGGEILTLMRKAWYNYRNTL